MSDRIRIDLSDQVAIVTGGGRGLGRAYCLDLAQRGAAVMVNDVAPDAAEAVVAHIRSSGGTACAATDTVATVEGAHAIVDQAVRCFGRVTVLVNNAGFLRNGYFEDLAPEDLDDVLAVHARGTFLVTQAAWPGMCAARYGRVVITGSAGGMFALPGASNYAAAKAAVFGLARALAQEGQRHGIAVNTILPRAASSINASRPIPDYARHANFPAGMVEALLPRRTVESVTPLVAYLASPQCALNGETLSAAYGRYSRVFVGLSSGWLAPDANAVEPEDIAAHLDEVMSLQRFTVPVTLFDEVRSVAAALGITEQECAGFHSVRGNGQIPISN